MSEFSPRIAFHQKVKVLLYTNYKQSHWYHVRYLQVTIARRYCPRYSGQLCLAKYGVGIR